MIMIKKAHRVVAGGVHRSPTMEWAAMSAGLLIATLSVHVSSLVEAEHRSVSVELPGWGIWAAIIGLASAVAPRLMRLRRRGVTSPAAPAERQSIVDHRDDAPTIPSTDDTDSLRHLLVRQPGAIQVVDVDSIRWIEADGRYVRLHTMTGRHLTQYTLAELCVRLDPTQFVQIHRSAIVNVRCIRGLRTSDYRDFDVSLDDASTLRLSRTYRKNLERALGSKL